MIPAEALARIESDEPLHVRVARALGCKPVYSSDPALAARFGPACWCANNGEDKGPHSIPGSPLNELARYDTDWSATGPAVERLFNRDGWQFMLDNIGHEGWRAFAHSWDEPFNMEGAGEGETPLLAICNLVLALKAAGKLEPPHPEEPGKP